MSDYRTRHEVYPISKTRLSVAGFKPPLTVPIMNFVRHGETDRKQLKTGQLYRGLNTNAEGFGLISEHLDLTDEGIETIRCSGQQLLERINREKEAILIVSSRSWRAHSFALILEDMLRADGVNLLNEPGKFKFFAALHENTFHQLQLEKKLGDYHGEEALNALRLLRHLNNIYRWLGSSTLGQLRGKRLRIICATHQEIMAEFTWKCGLLHLNDGYQGKGQILEIVPRAKLVQGKKVATVVELLPNRQRPTGAKTLVYREFTV